MNAFNSENSIENFIEKMYLLDFEKRAIKATAEVQSVLGCGVSFHPGSFNKTKQNKTFALLSCLFICRFFRSSHSCQQSL